MKLGKRYWITFEQWKQDLYSGHKKNGIGQQQHREAQVDLFIQRQTLSSRGILLPVISPTPLFIPFHSACFCLTNSHFSSTLLQTERRETPKRPYRGVKADMTAPWLSRTLAQLLLHGNLLTLCCRSLLVPLLLPAHLCLCTNFY